MDVQTHQSPTISYGAREDTLTQPGARKPRQFCMVTRWCTIRGEILLEPAHTRVPSFWGPFLAGDITVRVMLCDSVLAGLLVCLGTPAKGEVLGGWRTLRLSNSCRYISATT